MKIAIVCGHFVPTMGYIEVHLANAYQRLGHELTVITSDASSSTGKYLTTRKEEETSEYNIIRLKSWFSAGQIVLSKGIAKEIQRLDPDKVIVVGLGKVFPKEVFNIKNRAFELITLLGDNETNHYRSSKNLKRIFLQTFFKTPVYELAIKKSDRLVGYTPSTEETVKSFIKPKLKEVLSEKYSVTSLGFDSAEFNCNESERSRIREKLGIEKDELVVITATRITSAKKIENVIDAMATLVSRGYKFKYVLIGFTEHKYSQELKEYITSKELNDAVITLPFISRSETNDYYNMADIGLWTRAAISMFEGLATGLFVMLPAQKNVSHILDGNKGVYFTLESLQEDLEESIKNYDSSAKKTIAGIAKSKFSIDAIAQNLIAN